MFYIQKEKKIILHERMRDSHFARMHPGCLFLPVARPQPQNRENAAVHLIYSVLNYSSSFRGAGKSNQAEFGNWNLDLVWLPFSPFGAVSG